MYLENDISIGKYVDDLIGFGRVGCNGHQIPMLRYPGWVNPDTQ